MGDTMEMRKCIRQKLDDNFLTQTWLLHRLCDEGIKVEKTELSDVLRGSRFGPKSERIVAESAKIVKKYEKAFNVRKGTK